MGSDAAFAYVGAHAAVSIHAPAWGATDGSRLEGNVCTGFNSRSRMGSDLVFVGIERTRVGFNSRSRMGSDFPSSSRSSTSAVSIHAPAWGATTAAAASPTRRSVSIHAPAWGATRRAPPKRRPRRFQFTLPHGERPHRPGKLADADGVSIHAPAWGATARPSSRTRSCSFQFTLPHGERRMSIVVPFVGG